jgi:hypothetical protein
VVPGRDLGAAYGLSPSEVGRGIREQFRAYRATLQDDRRQLLERFEVVDMARKVVGVGSVGTRAFIVLFQGRHARDPSSCRSGGDGIGSGSKPAHRFLTTIVPRRWSSFLQGHRAGRIPAFC